MAGEDQRIDVAIGANVSGLVDGMKGGSNAVKAATDEIGGHFSNLASIVDNLKAPFLALTAVLGGGALFKNAISGTIEMTGETAKLARQLGVSTEEASGLREALEKLGIDTGTYGSAVFKLQIALRNQEEELNRNGIVTRNAKGEHLAIQDVMMNGIGRLKEMKGGFDANALSMLMWGRGAKEMQGLMRLTNDRIAEGTAETKRLGTAISGDQVAAMRAYKESMVDVKDVFEGIQVQIGSQLLPKLTALGQWFGENGPAIIGPVVSAFEMLTSALSYTTVQIALVVAVLYGPMMSAWAAASTAVMAFAQTLRVQMALGAMEGVTGIRALIGGLQSMINPWVMAAAVIIAACIGVERWVSSASRAAEEHRKMVQELKTNAGEFQRLSEDVAKYQETLENSKSTDQEKKLAQEKLAITIQQLRSLYPQYAAILTDENIKQNGIVEVLKQVNAEREKDVRRQIAQTESTLVGLKAKEADLVVTAATAHAWGALGDVWSFISGKRADDVSKAIKQMTENLNAQRAVLKTLVGEADGGGQKKPAGTFKDKPKGDEKDDKKLRAWKEELEQMKLAEGEWFTWSLQEELNFWNKKLAETTKGSKAAVAVLTEINKLKMQIGKQGEAERHAEFELEMTKAKENTAKRIDLAKAEAERLKGVWGEKSKQYQDALRKVEEVQQAHNEKMKRIAGMEEEAVRSAALAQTDLEEEQIRLRAELGQISAEQELQALMALEERRFQIKLKAAEDAIGLEADPEKQQEKMNQLQEVEQAHRLKTTQLNSQMTKTMATQWGSVFDGISAGWGTAINGLIKGTMSWGTAFRTIMGSMANFFIQNAIKMTMEWVKQMLIQKLASMAKAKAELSATSATAGASAADSAAKIPYVGWAIAIGAMAAVVAAVMGLGGSIGSAAGGWDQIPNDQIAQLHKNEMVLPANLAERVRNMTGDGEGGGRGGDQFHFTAQFMDGHGAEDFMRRNQGSLVKVMKEAARNGRMG